MQEFFSKNLGRTCKVQGGGDNTSVSSDTKLLSSRIIVRRYCGKKGQRKYKFWRLHARNNAHRGRRSKKTAPRKGNW